MLGKDVVGSGGGLPEFESQPHPPQLQDPKQAFSVSSLVKGNSVSQDVEDHTGGNTEAFRT